MIQVDGTDFTPMASRTSSGFQVTPPLPLPPGPHRIVVTAQGRDGQPLTHTASFSSRHTDAIEEIGSSNRITASYDQALTKPSSLDNSISDWKVEANLTSSTVLREGPWKLSMGDERMKRFSGIFTAMLGMMVLAALSAGEARAAVTVVPSQTSITAGQSSTISIQYRFSGLVDVGPYNGPETSVLGTFYGPTRTALAAVSTVVTGTITNGAGTVSETVTVPASVIDIVKRQGIQQITYERVFAGALNSPTAQVSIVFASSEAVGPLRIRRVELYFENRRGEITVERNRRGLKAFADIRFAGTGVLTGFWEVDGRRMLDVNRQLLFGTNVTLSTGDIPDLPTFDTGTHIVRFVVTSPQPSGTLPQLLYFVTATREMRPIRIAVRERAKGDMPGAKQEFTWEKPDGIEIFFIEFSEKPGGKPVFSAFSREGKYILPANGMEGTFTPGKRYFWRVKGYGANDDQVGESESAPFTY